MRETGDHPGREFAVMADQGPTYDEGHLFVAAVRVLEAKTGRPPSVEEVAELLGRSNEIAHMIVRGLEALGILRVVKTPFETHVEIVDHLLGEEIPRGERSSAFGDDLDAFREQKKKEQEEMEAFFQSGGVDEKKRKKAESLDNAFRKFRESKRSIFRDDDEEE